MKKRSIIRKAWLPLLIIAIIGASSIAFLFTSILNGTKPNDSNNDGTNGENNHQTDIKIVGKKIPPGYVMGNPIDIKLLSGMGALYLTNTESKISIRFTAQLSGEVSTLTLHPLSFEGQGKIRVGLQEDNEGKPKGKWISESSFGTSDIPNKSVFLTVNLHGSVLISSGNTYHIVIEVEAISEGSRLFIKTYLANSLAQPLNNEDPDIVWPDPRINSLFFDGEKWEEEDYWPIYVIGYTDGRCEGQPYSLEAPWVIYQSKYVGQTIIPASNYSIGKIAFVVGRKGQPLDKLYYEIRDQNNYVLIDGLFTETNQLANQLTWIEVSLPSPISLTAGKLYRIVLLSPGTKLENPYHLYGHEFSYNYSIGYGGLQHQLTASTNAGNDWIDNKDADAIFKITSTE